MRQIITVAIGGLSAILLGGLAAAANTPQSIEELWVIIQAQQAQIDALQQQNQQHESQLADTLRKVDEAELKIEATGDYLEGFESRVATTSDWGQHTQVGGYGEVHYNNLNAKDSSRDTEQIDLHRFVMFFNHQFDDRIRFFSELEVEHSFVKDTADGSGSGEVEVEQAYIEFDLDEQHRAIAGLSLIPVGIMNETHEPPTFYGVERNDVENIIIPSTWWEAGAGVGGQYANGTSWNLLVHSGLAMPTTGGSAFRVRSGRQKVAKAMASDFAYTFQGKYTGIPGLELAGTFQYQSDPSQIAADGLDKARLLSAHVIYNTGSFGLRALWADWDFDGTAVEAAGADDQSGWYIEPSWRFMGPEGKIGVYTRFEDVDGARDQDQFDQWELGLNYWPHPNVVIKVDYRDREHDLENSLGRDFDGFDLGFGYQF